MSRRSYPVEYRVEITGPAQGCEWSGTVTAMSKWTAAALAGVEAERSGVTILAESTVRVVTEEEA